MWKECERVLKPNGKLIINTPLMPMKKADYSTHYNRYIFDLNSDIQYSILYQKNTREFITVYVKDGKPLNNLPKKIKEASKLTEKE